MSKDDLLEIVKVFAPLSLLSFGGGQAAVPEIQHQTVAVHHWLTDSDFASLFALSRVAPGPSSTLLSSLIGWYRDGLPGALVAAAAIFGPSSLLMYGVTHVWQHHHDSRPLRILTRALAPIAVGLIFAGALTVLRAGDGGALPIATALLVCAAAAFTRAETLSIVAVVAFAYVLLYFGLAVS